MEKIGDWPFLKLTFTRQGEPDTTERDALFAALDSELSQITDLMVVVHGWNNNTADATALYRDLTGNMVALAKTGHSATLKGRQIAILGAYWPSMKWTDEELKPAADVRAAATGVAMPDLATALLGEKLDRLGEALGFEQARLAAVKEAAARLEDDAKAADDFVTALRALIDPPTDPDDDNSRELCGEKRGADLLEELIAPVSVGPAEARTHATSLGASGTFDVEQERVAAALAVRFGGIRAAAWRLLNYATYYVMKERAGTIGTGLNQVLARVRVRRSNLRFHLIGHSFGARVVTAATAGREPVGPSNLSLLQGAFSHNGFAARVEGGHDGFFRNVISENRVDGPIVATHTRNDRAVGIAYAVASRLSGDKRAAFGDATDVYGGIGRNGAVRMEQGEVAHRELEDETFVYDPFVRARVTNLLADDFIADHGDVTNPAVANAVLSAMRS